MRFGVHIRIARGLLAGLDFAWRLSCETVQLFSGNPNSWSGKPCDPKESSEFASRAASLGIRPVVLHTPYLINLASPDDSIWQKSKWNLADAMRKASMIGGEFVVTHVGSHKGLGQSFGISRVCEAILHALDADPNPTLLLELGSGAGFAVASRFQDAADILEKLGTAADRVAVCLDTAHMWATGYRINSRTGVREVFEEFDRIVGLAKLACIHLNDTRVELGCRQDRHYHIGLGRIGLRGFRAIVNHPVLTKLPGIIETPADKPDWDMKNLGTLRSLAHPIHLSGALPEFFQTNEDQ